ncbi:MAG: BamA/TamA family outer membrane protein [Bacteroidetes bacterium]|nr:BamA/TamA family outer membrane protein [Bacteroidota bacterium]
MIFAFLLFPSQSLHAQIDPSYYDSVQVADIRFEGNTTFSNSDLLVKLSIQESPSGLTVWIYENLGSRFPLAQEPRYFDFQAFQDDIALLRQYYTNNGFFSATVGGSYSLNDEGRTVDVVYTINEGPSSLIDSVSYRNLGALPPMVLGEINRSPLLRPGRRYSADEVHAERTRILEILANNGFPRAVVDTIIVERKLSDNNVIVKMAFRHGRRLFFGPITEDIKGVDELNLARKIVYDRVEFKNGDIYSRSRQNDAETNLNRLGVFSYVAISPTYPEITNQQDSLVPILLELQPRQRFEIAPGVLINNQLNGLTTGGEVSFLMRNVFAGAQTLTTRFNLLGRIGNITGTYIATSQLRFDQPYLISNKNSGYLAGTYSLVGEEDLADGSILQLVMGAERYLSKRSSAKLSWTYEISEFSGDAKALLGKGYINFDTTETINFRNSIRSFSIEEDGTDDLFNPSNGYSLKGIAEEAGYLEQIGLSPLPQENEALGIRSTQYVKLEGLAKYFHDMSRNRTTIFGAKFRLGGIFRFGKSKEEGLPVPPNRRYYAGGASSIRGWTARELAADSSAAFFGSNALLEMSMELRWHLFPNTRNWLDGFWFVAFADAGNLWTEFSNIDLTQTALAIGFGIRYNLFFGPIRVDFGMKAFNPSSADNRWFWEKQLWGEVVRKGVLQFGIGHAF